MLNLGSAYEARCNLPTNPQDRSATKLDGEVPKSVSDALRGAVAILALRGGVADLPSFDLLRPGYQGGDATSCTTFPGVGNPQPVVEDFDSNASRGETSSAAEHDELLGLAARARIPARFGNGHIRSRRTFRAVLAINS